MNEAQYNNTLQSFLSESESSILGKIFHEEYFNAESRTKEAWLAEIRILKEQLASLKVNPSDYIFFEYTIPRVGGRIDCGLIINDILYIIEFKTGESQQDLTIYKEQLEQYVIDLKNFHFESYDVPLVPVLLIESLPDRRIHITPSKEDPTLYNLVTINRRGLTSLIQKADNAISPSHTINALNWLHSPYCPTSDIVEAARKLFSGQTVEDIKRSDSEGEGLVITTKRIMDIIRLSKVNNQKSLCMITGVPGAGKTLIGLSVATQYKQEENESGIEQNRAVYLSGNHPLVTVLQEALTRDAVARKKETLKLELEQIADKEERKKYKKEHKITKTQMGSEVKQFIQMIYRWRQDYLRGILVKGKGDRAIIVHNKRYYSGEGEQYLPYDHVAIFDEAQRTWDKKEHSKFVRGKSKVPNFPEWSEARFLLSCMDRHQDWAVVVCLIGNGQDINHGEAGIGDWIESIKFFKEWHVYAPGVFQKDIDCSKVRNLHTEDDLHLKINLRSLRAENVSSFVDALLSPNLKEAKMLFATINEQYPICLTRDFNKAKQWLKTQAKSNERFGILASSKAQRLKPLAIDVSHSQSMNVKSWFLNDRKDVHSSYYLEDIATEFQVQGLEIDWACVAWDGDLIYDDENWKHRMFRTSGWQKMKNEQLKQYHINAYRVLLTRARRGMVICIPEGDLEDPTRDPQYYNTTYQYLKCIGLKELV